MANPIQPTNSFAGQSGPIPLSQLDANFLAITAAMNSFSTYANYLLDTSGTQNTITLTTPLNTTFSYTAGVGLQVQIANTTTSSTVNVNVNGLGSKSVLTSGGTAIAAGSIVAGQIVQMVYDGTAFRVFGFTANTIFPQVTIGPPTSGVALTVYGLAGQSAISGQGNFTTYLTGAADISMSVGISSLVSLAMGFNNTATANAYGIPAQWNYLATAQGYPIAIGTSATPRLLIDANGHITQYAPSTVGNSFTINGAASANGLFVVSPATTGASFGATIQAGTNPNDFNSSFFSAAGAQLAVLRGDGGLVMGGATGGSQGLGTVNATAIFVNGVAVGSGGTGGAAAAGTLTGTTLASNVTASSLTSVGALTGGSVPASLLSGTTLPGSITQSQLVTLGNVTGGTFPAANLSGGTLAAGITASSLTSLGTIANFACNSGSVNGFPIGYLNVPVNNQTASYTMVASDSGKMIVNSGASAVNTIPPNSSVPYLQGTVLSGINSTGGTQSLASTDSLQLVATSSTGTRTIAPAGQWTAFKYGTTSWLISGPGVT